MKLPSLLKVPYHALRHIFFPGTSRRTSAGIILFLLNFPVGWGGVSLFAALCAKYNRIIFIYLAAASYALSWIMLGASLILAGPAAINAFKKRLPQSWKAWKRSRKSQ
jgi:hypothetical protein